MNLGAVLIGSLTGFISAFFGIGGSSIDTPLLRTFLDLPPYLALGTPLPVALLTIAVALFTYWKKHLVNYHVFTFSVLGGLPGIILGSYFSHFFPGKMLMLFTSFALLFVGTNFILKNYHHQKDSPKKEKSFSKKIPAWRIVLATFFCSLLSGILANGGGLFLVPIFVFFFGLEIKEAIATSLLTVAVMIVPTCLIHYQLQHIDLATSVAMGIGVLPMSYVGAKLDLKTKSATLQNLFGILLIVFAVYFFISQI